ncbi:MAG: MBL fold metallo-hydrolase [Candidatus Hermodarchaeota archaeon]
MNSSPSFELKILYDNKCNETGFLTGFGFSAAIYNFFSNKYLLFDTGGNGNILIHNIKKFKLNISQIENIIISHNHSDHAGGLNAIYHLNPKTTIYVPVKNTSSFKRAFPEANIVGILEVKELDENIFSSGQINSSYIPEQALFLKANENKIILLVGCAHPGLERFILKSQQLGEIKAIFGGFHGFNKFSYLKNIEVIGACHCTRHITSISELYPSQFRKICVGDSFVF